MTVPVLMVSLLAIAVLGLIAHPLLSPTEEWDRAGAHGALTALARKRDRLLRVIKDLEFEHQAGLLSDEEFTRLRLDFKRRALQAMSELERARAARVRHLGQGRRSVAPSMLRRVESLLAARKEGKEAT